MLRVLLCLLVAGCSYTSSTPQAYVRRGPAFGQVLTPVVAFPVQCGATTMGCLPGYRLAVANATRMTLEFSGHTLVDSELINAEMGRRTSKSRETEQTFPRTQEGPVAEETTTTTTEVSGRTWLDLSPPEQRDLLIAMGIQGVLRATIAMSIPQGMGGQRVVMVEVALSRLADDQLVWQSRCGITTGDVNAEPKAIEHATRCALESGSLW